MEKINNLYGILMTVGGAVMVTCAGLVMASSLLIENPYVNVLIHKAVPWAFLLGSLLYVVCQRKLNARPQNFVQRRLQTIQLLSGLCFIASSLLMIEQYWGFLLPLVVSEMNSYHNYLRIVYNNWVLIMLVGALLQLYSTNRLSHEMRK